MVQRSRQQWKVLSTSVNENGNRKEYTVTCEADGTWKCGCPAWIFQKKRNWVNGKRIDCQHILRKRLELEVPSARGPITVTTKLEDDKVTRSITFEDV